MFNKLFFENIEIVCNLINYETPFPPDSDYLKTDFEKIISREDWNKLSNDNNDSYKRLIEFLIDKKIYNKDFISKEWEFNDKILMDIIQSFQFYLFKNCKSNQLIFDIKNLPYSLYDKDITKVFKAYADKYTPHLKLTTFYPILTEYGIELDSEDSHFLNFICDIITEEIVIEYFIHGEDMDFLRFSVFADWAEFDRYNKVILHAKTPNKRRNFNAILTQKNLYSVDLDNFYLLNEIYVPVRVVLKNRFNSKNVKFVSLEDFKNMELNDFMNYEYKFDGDYNPILIDDIFYEFKRKNINDISSLIYNDTDKIDLEYNLAFDFEEKNKLLRKELKKISNRIKNIELSESLLLCDLSMNVNNKRFQTIIKNSIAIEDDIIEDFLVNGINMNFYEYEIFDEWNRLCYNLKVIDYLKIKLGKLKNDNKLINDEKTETKVIEYFSKIWKDEIYEKMFHKYLIVRNVIDDKNNTMDGFKSQAGVILRIKPRIKKQIIKDRVTAKTFAQFLNKKYNAEIIITEKNFKMGNSDYSTEECEEFIESFLNQKH